MRVSGLHGEFKTEVVQPGHRKTGLRERALTKRSHDRECSFSLI